MESRQMTTPPSSPIASTPAEISRTGSAQSSPPQNSSRHVQTVTPFTPIPLLTETSSVHTSSTQAVSRTNSPNSNTHPSHVRATPSTPISGEGCRVISSTVSRTDDMATPSRSGASHNINDLSTPVMSNAQCLELLVSPTYSSRGAPDGSSELLVPSPAGKPLSSRKPRRLPMRSGLLPPSRSFKSTSSSTEESLVGEEQLNPSSHGETLFGEGLALSAAYSDSEDEDEDQLATILRPTGSSSRTDGQSGKGTKQKKLAPIKFKEDRKFCSFQGAEEYRQQTSDGAASPVHTPRHGPVILNRKSEGSENVGSSGNLTGQQDAAQYQPPLRNKHGVTQLAPVQDLAAIFKSPRKNVANKAPITPATEESSGDEMCGEGELPSPLRLNEMYGGSRGAKGDSLNSGGGVTHTVGEGGAGLSFAYSLNERDFSIPSIRLANQVHQSAGGSFARYGSYTSDMVDDASMDESYYSFLDDETCSLDNSLHSLGKAQKMQRRKRLSGLFRQASLSGDGTGEVVAAPSSNFVWKSHSLSFVEQMQSVSVDKPSTIYRRAQTFDLDNKQTEIAGPPSLLNLANASATLDDSVVDYVEDQEGVLNARPSLTTRRERGSRRRKKNEAAAVEWLNELKGNDMVVEAASSRFMTGGAPAPGGEQVDDSGEINRMLGLPHKLCRSSTIEAGPFVNQLGAEM